MGRDGNSSSFLLPIVLSGPMGFNFLPNAGFWSLNVAVGSLGRGVWNMSRSVSCRKERPAEFLASCAGSEMAYRICLWVLQINFEVRIRYIFSLCWFLEFLLLDVNILCNEVNLSSGTCNKSSFLASSLLEHYSADVF
ncbi:hypothetical protein RDI58_000899 [Solanum bulbocastanum]|uniref:Uncharacterized protein n=1 Tax=Solanum bulbocastanum TaxID=147425 RepID=A0AAN8YPH0_SOLBU